MLSLYTVLLNCHLLFRLTRKLALEMESLTVSLQIEVCLSQKWWDSLSRVTASLSPALWQGEREWLEQKPLLAEVLLFIPWYKNVYSGEAQSSAIKKAQSGAPAPTLTSPGNFWMLGSPNLKITFVCSSNPAAPAVSAGCCHLLICCFALPCCLLLAIFSFSFFYFFFFCWNLINSKPKVLLS